MVSLGNMFDLDQPITFQGKEIPFKKRKKTLDGRNLLFVIFTILEADLVLAINFKVNIQLIQKETKMKLLNTEK